MSNSVMIARLERYGALGAEDVQALESLDSKTTEISAGEIWLREGDKPSYCSVLEEGFAKSYKVVSSGAKQVLELFFPGQIVDADALILPATEYTVVAVSDCTFRLFDCDALLDLAFQRPEIGKAIWRESLFRASLAREWIVNVSRRDAKSRIAHVICEITIRMSIIPDEAKNGFAFPLNQDQLSNVVGLTPMHVSRILGRLEDEGIIERKGRSLVIRDWDGLRRVGDFRSLYLQAMI